MPFFNPPMLVTTHGVAYRYHRLEITKHANPDGQRGAIYNFEVQAAGVWYPNATMTSDSAPSPLVASSSGALSGTYAAWKTFDDSLSTLWLTSVFSAVTTGVFSPAIWVQFDLGSGNVIVPSAIRIAHFNSASDDRSLIDFSYKASNDGSAFTTIKSWTGESAGQTDATNKEYSL